MEKISCEVIRDLLPLYCDKVCSENSKQLIEHHLDSCCDCKEIYIKMKEDDEKFYDDSDKAEDESMIKNMASAWKRSLKKSFLKGMAFMVLVVAGLTGSYLGGTRIAVKMVPVEAVQADIISESEDDIHIYLETTDHKKVLKSKTVLTREGDLYIQFYRGLIPVNNGVGENLSINWKMALSGMSTEGKNVEIIRIYYGTEENRTLIWEKE